MQQPTLPRRRSRKPGLLPAIALAFLLAAAPETRANEEVLEEHHASVAMHVGPTTKLETSAIGAMLGDLILEGSGRPMLVIGGGLTKLPADGDLANASFHPKMQGMVLPVLSHSQKALRWLGLAEYDDRTPEWKEYPIDQPVAFAGSASQGAWLLQAGGLTSNGLTANVRAFRFTDDAMETRQLPPLPEPLAFCSAIVFEGQLLVAGGVRSLDGSDVSNKLYSLQLGPHLSPSKERNQQLPEWEVLDTTLSDGSGRAMADGLVQPLLIVRLDEIASTPALFILGGWSPAPAGEGFVPNRAMWRWVPKPERRRGWFAQESSPEGAALLSAAPLGQAHLIAFGQKVDDTPRILHETLRPRGDALRATYHTITNKWVEPQWEQKPDPDARVVPLGQMLFVLRPAGGDAWEIGIAEFDAAKPLFGPADWVMIGLYLLVLVFVGFYFAKRERDTEDYFLGGRKVPWWAAGLSIYATGISAISFMAIPAKTFATNWLYVAQGIIPVITTYIIAYAFLPLLRRLNITTIMQYKEMRFGRSIRLLSSALGVLGQIAGRMAVVMLLPAYALATVTQMDVVTCVLIMGVLSTVYTVAGGINAVIWTDVLQVVVVFGGAILSLALIAMGTEGGFAGVLEIGASRGKLEAFDWTWDFTYATVWVFCLWGLYDMVQARLGQEYVQRAFATRDVKSARRSVITCALVSVPGTLIFYLLGTALFAYYFMHPEFLNPTLNTDTTFPQFIAHRLPVGVAGLVIAGLFAAAMSTLDSGMNTVATITVTDWYSMFQKETDERQRLYVARWVTGITGVLATLMALVMAAMEFTSLWDAFISIMQLILGGLAGVIVLGLLTTRANTAGTWVGIIIGTAVMWLAKTQLGVSQFLYGAIAMIACVISGYLASLMLPGDGKSLEGLTVWTLRPSNEQSQEQTG